MTIVAAASQHIQSAAKLMQTAHETLQAVRDNPVQSSEQMQTDLLTVTALSTLASTHIAVADYIRKETLGL